MTYWYGADVNSLVVDEHGNVKPGTRYTLWDARTAGTQLTGWVDASGTAIVGDIIVADDRGQVEFGDPTETYFEVWAQSVDDPEQPRVQIPSRSIPGVVDQIVKQNTGLMVPLAQKGAAGGVASLDGSSKLTASQIPDSVYVTADGNIPNGVAALDAAGKASYAVMPDDARAGYVRQRQGRWILTEELVRRGLGSSDWQPAFAAVTADANPGDLIELTPGDYPIATAVTVPKPLHIKGYTGTILRQTNANDYALSVPVAAGGTIIEGLVLQGISGGGSASYGANRRAVYIAGTADNARVYDVTVKDCQFADWSFGVSAKLANRVRVTGCKFTAHGYAGVHLFSVNDAWVTDNYIDGLVLTGGNVDCYGITVYRTEAATITAEPMSRNVVIDGNTIRNVAWEGIDTHGGIQITIVNNNVLGCKVGIAVPPGDDTDGSTAVYGAKRLVIANNRIESGVSDGSAGPGISVSGAGPASGTLTDPATGIIANNSVMDHGTQGDASNAGGILCKFTVGMLVQGNAVYQCSDNGIQMYHTNHNCSVVANLIIDPWGNTSGASSSGIRFRDVDNSGIIVGNQIGRGAKVAPFPLYRGIQVHGTSTGMVNANWINGASNLDYVGNPNMVSVVGGGQGKIQIHTDSSSAYLLGFFGKAPVVRPSLTYSKTGETAAAAQFRTALAALGLITDSTTA